MKDLTTFLAESLINEEETIKSEKDFREAARAKFEEVFGDELDEKEMKKTIDGLLNDNKDLVEKGEWGELIGMLNQSFAPKGNTNESRAIQEKAFDPARFSMNGNDWFFEPVSKNTGGAQSGVIYLYIGGDRYDQGYWYVRNGAVSSNGPGNSVWKHTDKIEILLREQGINFADMLTNPRRKYDVVIRTKKGTKNGGIEVLSDGTKRYKK